MLDKQSACRIEAYQCGGSGLPAFFLIIGRETRTTGLRKPMAPHTQVAMHLPVVAVIDDDPAVRGSLKFSLELEGFQVRIYCSAADFLQSGDVGGCDCLVIDQRMPGMSGMELIARLRDDKVATPTILIISHSNAALSARAKLAGVPIVEKPFLGNALVEKIREACQAG
jgi:two-component system, LuxR family, response regulator FixJ